MKTLSSRISAQISAHISALRDSLGARADAALDSAIRGALRLAFRAFLRVKIRGMENFKGTAGRPLVIVANHSSLLDGVLLAATLPVKPAFAIATDQYEKFTKNPVVRFLFKRLTILPIDPAKPQAIKTMARLAQSGTPVMIFPEGRLTPTGTIMQIFDGASAVADAAGADILPVHIKGLHFLPFGTISLKNFPRTLFPDIAVTALPPRKLDVAADLAPRARRRARLHALERVMHGMQVEAMEDDVTLYSDLRATVRHFGRGRHAVEDHTRTRLSYAQVLTGAEALGAALDRHTRAGDAVGFLLPNSNAAAVTFWALQARARVPAMLNFSSDAPTLQSCIDTAEIRTILTSRTFVQLAKLEDKVAALAEKAKVVYLEDVKDTIGLPQKLAALGRARGILPRPRYPQRGADPAVVLFTSGSEGPPKGVVLSHANIRANIAQVSAIAPITPGDKVFNALPVFHSFGLGGGLIMPMLRGIPCAQYPSPLDGKSIPKAIYMSDATVMFGTDTFLRLYARGTDSDSDMNRLRMIFAGAEPLTEETYDTYLHRFGVKIYEGYGMTEASPVVAINLPGMNERGTVGRLLPGLKAKFEPVPDMEDGCKLMIKGPNVMLGYLKPDRPGLIQMPRDGWHDTGDIVRRTENGYIQIAGRAKRFAKVGGEMVSLDAIETIARAASPAAEQAAILRQQPGQPDQVVLYTTDAALKRDRLGQAAKALNRSVLGLPANENIRIVAEIPKLATGKTDYVSLRRLEDSFNAAAQRKETPAPAAKASPHKVPKP
jgi:acyl-[acyl-carrier-protein]-phospholipid O-acyltransferase/long-chain-fatty-acid--[acyl-carrier-protein] ligase